jgi:phospholipase D1/2
LKVDADGKVGPLPGSENFPDVGGKVLGAHSTTIPDALTT